MLLFSQRWYYCYFTACEFTISMGHTCCIPSRIGTWRINGSRTNRKYSSTLFSSTRFWYSGHQASLLNALIFIGKHRQWNIETSLWLTLCDRYVILRKQKILGLLEQSFPFLPKSYIAGCITLKDTVIPAFWLIFISISKVANVCLL